MQKIFHFDSPKEVYRSSAAVVGCFDARFHLVAGKLSKRMGLSNPDFVRVAVPAPRRADIVVAEKFVAPLRRADDAAVPLHHQEVTGLDPPRHAVPKIDHRVVDGRKRLDCEMRTADLGSLIRCKVVGVDVNVAELHSVGAFLDRKHGQVVTDRVERDQRYVRQMQFHGPFLSGCVSLEPSFA